MIISKVLLMHSSFINYYINYQYTNLTHFNKKYFGWIKSYIDKKTPS